MSRVHYSFDSAVAAVHDKPFAGVRAVPPRAPSRRRMRALMESAGLFFFGFGSTTLLIHIAVGFFLACRTSGLLPLLHV